MSNTYINLTVTETVEYHHRFRVTEALMAEAEAAGYERNVYGVANMLDDDPDHSIVANNATAIGNFFAVHERTASTEVD